MQWWNDFVDWFYSPTGQSVALGAVIPFVAILVSGLVAAGIARGSIKRLMLRHDRELQTSAVVAVIDGARQASVWNSLQPTEQLTADRSMDAADIQLRLLPIPGAAVAANWAGHEIREFKRASATFTLQFDAPLAEFRDRLIDWERHPRRARKIFERDLARWTEERSREDQVLEQERDAWSAQEAERYSPSDADRTPPTVPSSVPSSEAHPAAAVQPQVPPLRPHSPDSAEDVAPPVTVVSSNQPFWRAEPAASIRSDPAGVAAPSSDAAQDTPVRSPVSEQVAPADDTYHDNDETSVIAPQLTPFRAVRPGLPTQIHDADDEPGAVERPTDEPYAPPIPAAFGRSRPVRD